MQRPHLHGRLGRLSGRMRAVQKLLQGRGPDEKLEDRIADVGENRRGKAGRVKSQRLGRAEPGHRAVPPASEDSLQRGPDGVSSTTTPTRPRALRSASAC